jgi:hypothetical protein
VEKNVNRLYFVYAQNLLQAAQDFEGVDDTLRSIFLALSSMLLDRVVPEDEEPAQQGGASLSGLAGLSEEDQRKVTEEIDRYVSEIRDGE